LAQLKQEKSLQAQTKDDNADNSNNSNSKKPSGRDQVEILKDLLRKQGKGYLLEWLQDLLLDTCQVKVKVDKSTSGLGCIDDVMICSLSFFFEKISAVFTSCLCRHFCSCYLLQNATLPVGDLLLQKQDRRRLKQSRTVGPRTTARPSCWLRTD